jgi:hypothetical protein
MTYLKGAGDGSSAATWEVNEDGMTWAIEAADRATGRIAAGTLAGVGRDAGETVNKGYFDDFAVRPYALVRDNWIAQNAIVADGYGIRINGLTDFEITGNVVRPVYGRGLLVEGTDAGAPTVRGEFRDNWFEAREKYNLEYDGGKTLEATAVRLRNYEQVFQDLHFDDNVLYGETTKDLTNNTVWAAIGVRVSLKNQAGQATDSRIRFEGNTIKAVVKTDDTAYYAFAVTTAGVGDNTGLEFRDNVLESNHRTINIGDNDTGTYGVWQHDILFDGNTLRRATGTGVSDRTVGFAPQYAFQTVVMGDEYLYSGINIDGIRLVDQHFDFATVPALTKKPLFLGTGLIGDVTVEWRVRVVVADAAGPAPGAAITVTRAGQSLGSGTADQNGEYEFTYTNTVFSRIAGGSLVEQDNGSFQVTATSGTRSASASLDFDDLDAAQANFDHNKFVTLMLP